MLDTNGVIDHITGWLKHYCESAGQQGFVVGVSGGIDSAVVSTLCARTGLRTHCVEMPVHQLSAHVSRTREHMAWLQQHFSNVSVECVDLTPAFDALVEELPAGGEHAARELALANTRARLRMTTLYYLAGTRRALVAGTGNKVEDFGVGFYTKYGDGGVDLSPIGDLFKSEVYTLAGALGIVDSIRQAKPSDGLFADGRSDEDQLGATYPELEWAMAARGAGGEPGNLSERQRQVLSIFDRLHRANRHKWLPVPVCEIPAMLRS